MKKVSARIKSLRDMRAKLLEVDKIAKFYGVSFSLGTPPHLPAPEWGFSRGPELYGESPSHMPLLLYWTEPTTVFLSPRRTDELRRAETVGVLSPPPRPRILNSLCELILTEEQAEEAALRPRMGYSKPLLMLIPDLDCYLTESLAADVPYYLLHEISHLVLLDAHISRYKLPADFNDLEAATVAWEWAATRHLAPKLHGFYWRVPYTRNTTLVTEELVRANLGERPWRRSWFKRSLRHLCSWGILNDSFVPTGALLDGASLGWRSNVQR